MSDAAAPGPVRQSASQLSENIGDVLASIRRLIAQDEDAGAGAPLAPLSDLAAPHAAVLSADGASAAAALPGGGGGFGPHPVRSEAAVARRRDIMAEAQALNRRSEAAFGNAAAARAGAAGFGLSHVGTAVTPVSAAEALPPPGDPAEAPSGAASGTASSAWPRAAATDSAPLRLSSPLPKAFVAEAATGDEAADARPSTQALSAASSAPRPAEAAPPSATDTRAIPPLPEADAPTPRLSEPDMTLACTPAAAPSTNAAQAGAAPAPEAGGDDAAGSVLGLMIRAVVRSELQEGGMTRHLRAMILREVAQALTAGDRGR